MHPQHFSGPGTILIIAIAVVSGCAPSTAELRSEGPAQSAVGAHEALQARGEQAMGVDQYTSTHVFDDRVDGGRIELQRDTVGDAGTEAIRRHVRVIAEAFAAGDFQIPAFVHEGDVPGTAVMAARKDRIRYVYRDLPRGAELRLVTDDPAAIRAIHEFMAFQREAHRAEGIDHDAMHRGSTHHDTMHHDRMDHGTEHQGGHARRPDLP